jgi:hypothetical protein
MNLSDRVFSAIAASDVDVLSVDLDGNDLYFTEALLNVLRPKLVIVEYNAKFPPPAGIVTSGKKRLPRRILPTC